ncbi:MAG: hypothetical protein ACRC7O_03080 [Fimbriiglobus sp.]
MGFAVMYRSTRPVAPAETDAIRQTVRTASEGRTWLGCEPVHLHPDDDGYLFGISKPNILPHPEDAADAARSGLPDGTARDMLDVLCRISRDHAVDWALSHDYDPHIGFIRAGVCDGTVLDQIVVFADMSMMLAEEAGDWEADPADVETPAARHAEQKSDENDPPSILTFRPKGT